jgi:arabinose-5-phosphate isomerase
MAKSMHLGKKVIQDAANALYALSNAIPESFQKVADFLLSIDGKVVCSGMGKSGYIAQKMAATLASTGTPAFFIHPAEAVHGDLGMIESRDALLIFSLSGETPETLRLLQCSRAHRSIVITACPNSSMGRLSNWILDIPKPIESCPLGMSPTTSCAVMMALGDALAMTLSAEKNFSKEDFGHFHPAGALGLSLKTVGQVMATPAPVVGDTALFPELLTQWIAHKSGILALTNSHGKITGIVTPADIPKLLGQDFRKKIDLSTLPVFDSRALVATLGPCSMDPENSDCPDTDRISHQHSQISGPNSAANFLDFKINSPGAHALSSVASDGASLDPLSSVVSDGEDHPLDFLLLPAVHTLSEHTPIPDALEKLHRFQQSAMIVVDGNDRPIGIFYHHAGITVSHV